MNTLQNTDWSNFNATTRKEQQKLFAKHEKHAKPLDWSLQNNLWNSNIHVSLVDAGDLRKKWFFFLKYPSTTRAFWRIKLNQWDFRTRVIMTNTSLTIGLQVPDRLNCVTHHLTHLNWNTEGADYMVTSVRQTSNQARLKQLLIKTNKLLIVKLSLGNTLYKNVMWASNLEHKNCTFLIL